MRLSVLVSAVLLLGCLGAVGCFPAEPVDASTQMLVAVETNSEALRERFTHVRATIYRREGDDWKLGSRKTFSREKIAWPLDLPVIPGSPEDRAKQFEVIVEALEGEVLLAQTRAVTRFLPGQRLLLRLWLDPCSAQQPVCGDDACHGAECKVCRAGECVDVGEIDPSVLPMQPTDRRPTSFEDIEVDAGSTPDTGRDASHDPSRGDSGSDASNDAEMQKEDSGHTKGPDVPDDAGSTDLSCSDEGTLRCAMAGTAERQRCQEGKWTAAEPCEMGRVCDEKSSPKGACRELAAACVGNAGKVVCEGESLIVCDAQGSIASMTSCESANHCQRGLALGKCAVCLPGEHECKGAELQVCAEDGQGFGKKETCGSAALCNKSAGQCGMGCKVGSKSCAGDTLQRCKADLTGFETEKTCGAGLCDQAGQQCDVCTPSTKSCMGNSVRTCDAQGQGYTTQACAAPKGVCTGNGVCVECTATSPCAASSDPCWTSSCDVAAGTCKRTVNLRARCAGGVCDSSGDCVGCIDRTDCPSTRPICSAGQCVQCTSAANCNASKHEICQNRQCVVGPYCGDGLITSGEQCDPKAPGWNPFTCSEACVIRNLYNSCGWHDDCDNGIFCGLGFCWYGCTSDAQCPAPPVGSGLRASCGFGGACMLLGCRSAADCPEGNLCVTGGDGTTRACMGCDDVAAPCPAGKVCFKRLDDAGNPTTTGRCR